MILQPPYPSFGGGFWAPMQVLRKMLKTRAIRTSRLSSRPPTWTFAGHQSPSYQTYSDVKHINRKPAIKSTILDGQTLDLSLPGYVYKQKTKFFENLIFSSLAKSRHTSGIKSRVSWDGFNAVLDRF